MSDAPDPQTSKGGGHVPPVWHDGTERSSHRPWDAEEQQAYGRGKKKCHPLKNLLVIDETCQSYFLSVTYEGKANVTIIQPKKKPQGGELTPPEQATNQQISSTRIWEQAIGGVKRFRVVRDKIRLLKDRIRDTVMEMCSGLHNFRLQYRPWDYAL